MRASLVVLEPDPGEGERIAAALRDGSIEPRMAPTLDAALALVEQEPPDALLLDLDALGEARARDVVANLEGTPVLFCGRGGAKQAVLAIRAGGHDFVERPIDVEGLTFALQKVLARGPHAEEPRAARDGKSSGLLGNSKAMRHVFDVIQRVASSDATALLRGESGTGKELVARALHRESPRSAGPFVKVTAAGLPEALLESELFGYERGAFTGATCRKPGRVEIAEGGTLFLDEVGDISPAVQVKLLRLLQDREYERLGGSTSLQADVRFIAATHRDLEHMIRKGEFREDLFYRLNVVPIWLPPLRARRGDVADLAVHFCATFAEVHRKKGTTLSSDAITALTEHRWPGNVRELQNFVERLVVFAGSPVIGPSDVKRELSPDVSFATEGPARAEGSTGPSASLSAVSLAGPVVPLDAAVRAAERSAIERALRHVKGNRTLAAKLLGVGQSTLYKKIVALGIDE